MKFNSTVALTVVLLTLMVGAGVVSGVWGFALGYEALKGVTQPDARPKAKTIVPKDKQSQGKGLVFLKEADILKNVKARMQGNQKETPVEKKEEASAGTKTLVEEKPNSAGFPIISKDRGVTLEIRSVHQQGGSLLMEVSLKNEGTQTVQFLYSFLDVSDNQGRALTATAEGLPSELPPNSGEVAGTISIPTAVLDGTDQLSLTLTDYPDQQLRLQASKIPVR